MRSPPLALAFTLLAVGCGAGSSQPEGASPTDTGRWGVSAVAEIVCERTGPRVLTPEVATQPDGLHLEVRNETAGERSLSVEAERGHGRGQSAPVGTTVLTWPIPPGTATVRCAGSDEDPSEARAATLELVDEAGLWVDTSLACAGYSSSTGEYPAGAKGRKVTPEEVVRAELRELLRPADTVERAGYPESSETWVRIVRAGEVAVTVTLTEDGSGGWLVETVNRCDDA